MDIASIMSPLPVSVSPAHGLERATELMDEQGVRHLPVVEGGRVVGLVSDRDLLAHTGWRPARNGLPPQRVSNEHRSQRLEDVMHPPTRRLAPEDSLLAAVHGIAEQRIGCVTVERDGILMGIVTEIDVLRAFVDLVRTGALPEGSDRPVAELMTREVAVIQVDTTLAEALELCEAEAVRHLPVLAGRELAGMVSDRDLALALGRGAGTETEVSTLMSPSPLTLATHELVSTAATRLADEKVGALPILEGNYLAGMLSTTDVLEHVQAVLGA